MASKPHTQSIIRPGLEPVNGTTVDEGRELPDSTPEGISYGAEGQDHVELLSTSTDKVVEEGERGVFCILVLRLG